MLPWGTPQLTHSSSESTLLAQILCFLDDKYSLNQSMATYLTTYTHGLQFCVKDGMGDSIKGFLLIYETVKSKSIKLVETPLQIPNWLVLNILFLSSILFLSLVCTWSHLSNIFANIGRVEIGL